MEKILPKISIMKILLLGGGGRIHVFAWKISQSPLCSQLYIAPGNAGTATLGVNIDIDFMDFEAVKEVVIREQIDFVIVGPEAPLVAGIVDYFQADPLLQKIPVLGPDQEAALLEGSKTFAKDFMRRHGIPTARYMEVDTENVEEGLRFLNSLNPPYVLKADGLAFGKGVLIIDRLEEAHQELQMMLDGKFGEASKKVVIEEFLDGTEFSVFTLTDGSHFLLLPEAKDYKRIGDGDQGLNTGGMGSISPVPFFTGAFREKVKNKIILPTIAGLQKDKMHYTGFVFFGLIKVQNEPYVIEYNCRMGDPEAQSVIPRIEEDLLPALLNAAKMNLKEGSLKVSDRSACSIVAVSGGYPGDYERGKKITGIDQTEGLVFHAGTKMTEKGEILTNGGRVLAVTAISEDPAQACVDALRDIQKINYEGIFFRKDIGRDILEQP